jgi:hypothetical protein
MQRNTFRSGLLWSTLAALIAAIAPAAHAFELPIFNKDIVPNGLSVAITSKEVKPPVGPTSLNASFKLETPYTSFDFSDDICHAASDAVLMIGTAPSQNCKTGEKGPEPITIALSSVVSNPACTSFTYSDPSSNLTADWTIKPYKPSPGGGNQSISCINGKCTVTQSGGVGSGPTPTNVLTFTATTTNPDVIAVPSSKVDVFILYTADDDGDDPNPSALWEGDCVTLNLTSSSTQTKSVKGTTTTTKTFAAAQ